MFSKFCIIFSIFFSSYVFSIGLNFPNNKETYNKGEDVVITIEGTGKILIESDLKLMSWEENLNNVGISSISLGKVSSEGYYFVCFNQNNVSETLLLAFFPEEMFSETYTFFWKKLNLYSPKLEQEKSLLERFSRGLTIDRLMRALKKGIFEKYFPENAMGLSGTFVVCLASIKIPVVVVYCKKMAVDQAKELGKSLFFALIEVMEEDKIISKEEYKAIETIVSIIDIRSIYREGSNKVLDSKWLEVIGSGLELGAEAVDNEGAKLFLKNSSDFFKKIHVFMKMKPN